MSPDRLPLAKAASARGVPRWWLRRSLLVVAFRDPLAGALETDYFIGSPGGILALLGLGALGAGLVAWVGVRLWGKCG